MRVSELTPDRIVEIGQQVLAALEEQDDLPDLGWSDEDDGEAEQQQQQQQAGLHMGGQQADEQQAEGAAALMWTAVEAGPSSAHLHTVLIAPS